MADAALLFDPCQVEHGGHFVRGLRIDCGKCGKNHKIHFNQLAHGQKDDQANRMAARKFEQAGWEIGKRWKDHRCPACVAASLQPQPKLTVVPNPMPETKAQPRTAKEDRRIIFAQLNEVYVDEKTGYQEGWNDGRVAKHLGVPLEVVKELREENFGPPGIDPGLVDLITEARLIREQVIEKNAEASRLVSEIDKLKVSVQTVAGDIQRLASRTEVIEKKLVAMVNK